MRFDDGARRRLEVGIAALLAGEGDEEWRGRVLMDAESRAAWARETLDRVRRNGSYLPKPAFRALKSWSAGGGGGRRGGAGSNL